MKTKDEVINIENKQEVDNSSSSAATEAIDVKPKKLKVKKPRVWELDFLRGLSIILVCWDHLMFDAFGLFGAHFLASGNEGLISFVDFARTYWTGDLRAFFRPIFLFIFFFVSGICVSFSRNNLFRSLKLVIAALVVNLGTWLAATVLNMDCFILFGVVHSFSVIVLIYALIELFVKLILKNAKKEHLFRYVMSGAALIFAIIGIVIDAVYNVSITEFDQGQVATVGGDFVGVIFFKNNTFWNNSADYFPIFPFFNYFFIGAAASTWLYPKKKSLLPCLDHKWHYPVTIPGRVSLYIYILVQVIAVIILGFVSLVTTGSIGIF